MTQAIQNKKSLIAIAALLLSALLFCKMLFLNNQYNSSLLFFVTICILTFLLAYHLQYQVDKNKRNYYEIEGLTNSVNGGIVTYALDNKLRIIYANEGYYNLIGYSREEVRTKFNNSGLAFMGKDELMIKMGTCAPNVNLPKDIHLEFKLTKKNGSIIWIRANCHRTDKAISYFMMDVTEAKKAEQELLLEKERYHIATELTNDIIFEYDIAKDEIRHSLKYQDIFGRTPFIGNFTKSIDQAKWISPSTLGDLKSFCHDLCSGKPTMSAEVKLLNAQGKYTWCHMNGKTLYDSNGLPTKVIGKIVNIDAQKKALEELQNKACRDPLTGLYNKIVTKTLIEDIIQVKKPRQCHAFMIIDIDNFKAVNDNYGHLIGDEVLIAVTTQLKTFFGKKDIVGRIGGDEFVVLMSNVNSTKDIMTKASELSSLLRNERHTDTKNCSISGSIGISVYPSDGSTYSDLLKSADSALYKIKNQGKNNFALANSADKYYF